MKITVLILLVACLQVSATGYAQKVTLTARNMPLEKVLNEIKKQTGYLFFYNQHWLKEVKNVNVSVQAAPIDEVLTACFEHTPFTYSVVDKTIIITRRQTPLPEEKPRQLPVSGKVTDENGQALPGVTIQVKGTGKGAITAPDGTFAIEVADGNAVLQFRFTGMQEQEVTVGDKSVINIVMKASLQDLGEVVVVGYGTAKKETLAGAVGVITSKDIGSKPSTNLLSAIQGVMPGLTVTRTSGRPGGEGYSFDIRGISSINGGGPLVIIDGIPNPLGIIDPNDVESVSVLKDAAASIYGARAASGVILITTKSGRKGKPVIQYSTNFALKTPAFLKNKTTTLQYALMYNEANVNDGKPKQFSEEFLQRMRDNDPNPSPTGSVIAGFPQFFTTTDWNGLLYKTGSQQYHNLNISGGTDNSAYVISGGFFNTGGIYNVSDNRSNRYNLRVNYDHSLSKRLKAFIKLSFEEQDNFEPSMLAPASGTFNVLSDFVKLPSFVPAKTPGGKYYQWQGFVNPLQEMAEGGEAKSTEQNAIGNLKLEYTLADGLKLVGQAGITMRNTTNKKEFKTFYTWNWDESQNSRTQNVPNRASLSNSKSRYGNFIGHLDYDKTFGGKHHVTAMAGASRETYHYESLTTSGTNFSSNEIFSFDLADKSTLSTTNGAFAWGLNSFFSRLGYVYNNKYILEASLRLDGSSRFAADKRWSALFPSISAAWRLSEENFVKRLNLFDDLKLRASWGQMGNQDINGLGYYNYIQLITIGTTAYPFGNGLRINSASLSGMASPDRTWETVEMKNAGIDIALLKSRLSMSFDYFVKENRNMLLSVTLPEVLGVAPPTTNAGKLRVHGWEMSLGWNDHIGNFEYGVRGGLSDNQNKLVYVGGADPVGTGLIGTKQGYPQSSYFGYVYDGIIQNDKELEEYKKNPDGSAKKGLPGTLSVGDARYRDLNGDGSISTAGDLVFLGNPAPRYNYFVNLSAQWKGIDFAAFVQGVGKRNIIRSGDEFYRPFNKYWAQPLAYFYEKTWAPERPDAKYPRLSMDNTTLNWNYIPSSNQLVNTAYVRLKNLQVGYSLPASLISRIKLAAVRIYFSGENLWESSQGTWDGSYDPEEGNDAYSYPFVRTWSLGLNVKF
ncbi:TonB-dependent receptor [Chitinophaga cymbidii]|nr:TonB-dependent receptor [Chitinophaga cymbidii]